MPAEPVEFDSKKHQEQELRTNIAFYLRHLSRAELRIVRNLTEELARNYSDSYKEYVNKSNANR